MIRRPTQPARKQFQQKALEAIHAAAEQTREEVL